MWMEREGRWVRRSLPSSTVEMRWLMAGDGYSTVASFIAWVVGVAGTTLKLSEIEVRSGLRIETANGDGPAAVAVRSDLTGLQLVLVVEHRSLSKVERVTTWLSLLRRWMDHGLEFVSVVLAVPVAVERTRFDGGPLESSELT
ncbi:hypothetical protein NL676_001891 [Syzygium grande]|nr:hypothetical protein NL676_001891 [Syzygium grande]